MGTATHTALLNVSDAGLDMASMLTRTKTATHTALVNISDTTDLEELTTNTQSALHTALVNISDTTDLEVLNSPHDGTLIALVYRITLPVLLLVGTAGNTLMVAVLLHARAWKSAFCLILLALALSDQMVLITVLFSRPGAAMMGYFLNDHSPFLCTLAPWVQKTFEMFSSYLLVLLSVQRATSVVLPHYVGVLCTRRKTALLMGCIFVLALFMTVPALIKDQMEQRGSSTACVPPEKSVVLTLVTCNQLMLIAFLPFCCLVVCNVLLCWHLALSVRKVTGDSSRQKRTSSTSLTVIVLSFVFLLSGLPRVTTHIYYYHKAVPVAIQLVTQHFKYVNNVFTFYLYCLTGTRFRAQLKALLSSVCRGPCGQ